MESCKDHFDKPVIMGIRPENVHDEEAYLSSMQDSIVEASVEVTEAMGAETYLYLNTAGVDYTARVNPRSTAKAGGTVKVAFEHQQIHIFDKENRNDHSGLKRASYVISYVNL